MATLETIESKTVKRLRSIFTLVALLANAGTGFAQGFMNLNFEAANTSSYASSGFIPTNNAIPGWTIYMESTYYPIVAYNTIALAGC